MRLSAVGRENTILIPFKYLLELCHDVIIHPLNLNKYLRALTNNLPSFILHNPTSQDLSHRGILAVMVQPPPSISRLLTLARTGATAGTSIHEALHKPYFRFLRSFFATWLRLDLTTLASLLTIFGTLSGALRIVQGLALKLYWWFTKFFTASISIAGSDRLNREIVNWLASQVLTRGKGTRILTARTETIQNDAFHMRRTTTERNDYLQ